MKKKPLAGFSKKPRPFATAGADGRKPFGKPGFGKPAFGKPSFAKPGFGKSNYGQSTFSKPAFEQGPRGDEETGQDGPPATRTFRDRPPHGGFSAPHPRRSFGDKPGSGRPFGDRPSPGRPFEGKPPFRKSFNDDAAPRSRSFGEGTTTRRPFNPDGPPSGMRTRRPFADRFEDDESANQGTSFGRPFAPKAPGRPYNGNSHGNGEFEARDDRRTSGKAAGRKVNLNFDDLIYGVHAVEEALRSGEKILSLHVGRGRDRDPIVAELCAAAERLEVPVKFEDAAYFDQIAYKAHQSVIAIGEPFNYVTLAEAIAVRQTDRLIVVLDHLTDPHNVGAIIRTAECAGAQAAVLPDRRSAGINATVRKGAAGATSHLAVAKVGNLAQTLRELKSAGFTVVGAALDETAQEHNAIDFTGDVALVIGAEGEGLGRLVARECDQLVKIPLLGKTESLNASVAAGVLLYEVVRQRSLRVSA